MALQTEKHDFLTNLSFSFIWQIQTQANIAVIMMLGGSDVDTAVLCSLEGAAQRKEKDFFFIVDKEENMIFELYPLWFWTNGMVFKDVCMSFQQTKLCSWVS